jgi:15-cis-phytoene synthase
MNAEQIMKKGSKSFSLAAKLLPREQRDAFTTLYAYCRRVDDAIDLAPPEQRANALTTLRGERDPALEVIIERYQIPRGYFEELLAGMEMDVVRTRYRNLDHLILYCYRVAGVVGLMLAHIMGVRDRRVLRHAQDLGIAMQLTNICRDVAEDAADGRSYIPPGSSVRALLDEADLYYSSADRGIPALPFRCALAVRAARLIYAAIGTELRRRDCDPYRGRVVVPLFKKLFLVLLAIVITVGERLRRRHDVVPV